MTLKLYYLFDTKSNTGFHSFFAQNKDVALRCLSGELRELREKNCYTALALWEDSTLQEIDLDKSDICISNTIPEYKKFFEGVQNENKNMIK